MTNIQALKNAILNRKSLANGAGSWDENLQEYTYEGVVHAHIVNEVFYFSLGNKSSIRLIRLLREIFSIPLRKVNKCVLLGCAKVPADQFFIWRMPREDAK